MQRGFVWNVVQIESLWDSLLRGFPIGSLLLSRKSDGQAFLLDGQQRATSIALGFYNPWANQEPDFWSLKNIPVIWVDLIPKNSLNSHKYAIKVVTRFHPWGYALSDKEVCLLSINDRKKALELLRNNPENNDELYLNFELTNVFPYDTTLPVPLSFLVKSVMDGAQNWKDVLLKDCTEYISLISPKYCEGRYIDDLQLFLKEPNSAQIKKAIDLMLSAKVPVVEISHEILVLDSDDNSNEDNPTLFVRLNSGGTVLTGEELNYSIYKATFPLLKNLVEDIGCSFIQPSKVISLVSRLVLSDMRKGTFPNKVRVKEFQRLISNEKFKDSLSTIIGNDSSSPAKELFTRAIEIFKDTNINIPTVLIKSIVTDSGDLFLLLLRWLQKNDSENNPTIKRNIIGSISTYTWFGKSNDIAKELWHYIDNNNLWGKDSYDVLCKLDQPIIGSIISPDNLKSLLLPQSSACDNTLNNIPNNPFFETCISLKNDTVRKIDVWNLFINNLLWNRSFLVFAQNEYINKQFKIFNQMELIQDTNTPWDWDHIYPASWVYNKRNIDPDIRFWVWTIGNLRALALETNRSIGNISPKDRLEDEEISRLSFITDARDSWLCIDSPLRNGDNRTQPLIDAIKLRICSIYKKWFDIFKIDEII